MPLEPVLSFIFYTRLIALLRSLINHVARSNILCPFELGKCPADFLTVVVGSDRNKNHSQDDPEGEL